MMQYIKRIKGEIPKTTPTAEGDIAYMRCRTLASV
jgi:hypothetical protein